MKYFPKDFYFPSPTPTWIHMKSRSLLLLGVILLVAVPLAGINASAYPSVTFSEPFTLEITYANYLDLDADGIQDDITTSFKLFSPFVYEVYMIGTLDLYLELPSGLTWWCTLDVDRVISEVEVTVEWYNCATEAGWYDFTVELRTYAITPMGRIYWITDFDNLIFDPPEDEGIDGAHPFVIAYWG